MVLPFFNYKYKGNNMGFLESVYKIENQLANQWELVLDDQDFKDFTFRVSDVNLPFYKLDVETKYSGEKVYKSLTEPGEVTITLREDIKFGTYKYFNTWFSSVYDLTNRVFKNQSVVGRTMKSMTLKFLKQNFLAINVPYTGSMPFDILPGLQIDKPSFGFRLIDCKIVGVDPISLNYDGAPLSFSITLIPEEIQFQAYS